MLPSKFRSSPTMTRGDAELDDGSGAHHAGAERGVERRGLVVPPPAGAAQAIHLAVSDGVAFLDAPVVAGTHDLAVLDQNRTNR